MIIHPDPNLLRSFSPLRATKQNDRHEACRFVWCATETPNYIHNGGLRHGTVFQLNSWLSFYMRFAPELVARKIDPEDLPRSKKILKEMCYWIDGSEERGKMLSDFIDEDDGNEGYGLRKKTVSQYLRKGRKDGAS